MLFAVLVTWDLRLRMSFSRPANLLFCTMKWLLHIRGAVWPSLTQCSMAWPLLTMSLRNLGGMCTTLYEWSSAAAPSRYPETHLSNCLGGYGRGLD